MCNSMVPYVACTLLRTCGSSTLGRSGKYATVATIPVPCYVRMKLKTPTYVRMVL